MENALELLKLAAHVIETPGDFTAEELQEAKNSIGAFLANQESEKVRYYLGKLSIRIGEYENELPVRFMTDGEPDKYLDIVASRFYNEQGGDEDEGGYLFDGGCIRVTPGLCREITKDYYIQSYALGAITAV